MKKKKTESLNKDMFIKKKQANANFRLKYTLSNSKFTGQSNSKQD